MHVYWALGGKWGMDAVLPVVGEDEKPFMPGMFATLAVALVLGGFAFITTGNLGIYGKYVPLIFFKYASLVLSILFFLRAIGDFKYVGFFKKATNTLFAKNDTRYYSPLCMIIAVLSFLIFILNQ